MAREGHGRANSIQLLHWSSWSWAAYHGAAFSLTALGQQQWESVAVLNAWHTELKNMSNPHGELKTAWIQIRGSFVQITAGSIHTKDEKTEPDRKSQKNAAPRTNCRVYTSCSGNGKGSALWLDHPQNDIPETLGGWNAHILMLRRMKSGQSITSDSEATRDLVWGLAIKKTMAGENSGTLERVDWMYIPGGEVRRIVDVDDNWKMVTLV